MHTSSFSFFSSVYYVFVLFSFVVLLIFQADTSLFSFHLIVENLILHIFLIIMIIILCSGCFGMFHVPGFIDAHINILTEMLVVYQLNNGALRSARK